jgi:hypothetical protein
MTSIAGGGDGTTTTMAITEGLSAGEIIGSSSGATMGMAQTSEREGETTELRKSAGESEGEEEEGITATTTSSINTETTIKEEMQSSSSSTINAKDMGREEEGQTTQTDHAPFQTSDGFQLDFTMGADGGIASSEGTATMMTNDNEGEGMQKGEEGETTIQDSTTTTSSSLTTTEEEEEEEGISSSSSSSPPLEGGSAAAAEEDHSSSTEAVGMGIITTIQGEGQQQQEEGAEEQMIGQGWEKTDFEAGQLCMTFFYYINPLN